MFLALCTVSFSDEEESKYRKDFVVDKTIKLEVPKSTSGSIRFEINGNYIVEILGDGSNIALNDAISVFRGKKESFIGPKEILEDLKLGSEKIEYIKYSIEQLLRKQN